MGDGGTGRGTIFPCKLNSTSPHHGFPSRDYEVRERIPEPHDNYFQSFFSSRHAILGNYNLPLSLKLNDVTLTDQSKQK